MTNQQQVRPNVSRVAFWDVDFDKIDFDLSSSFVMAKIFNYGTWADIIETLRFYGLDRVSKEVVQVAYFKNTALSFLCTILNLTEQDFVAYQRRQARKPIWDY